MTSVQHPDDLFMSQSLPVEDLTEKLGNSSTVGVPHGFISLSSALQQQAADQSEHDADQGGSNDTRGALDIEL